MQETAFAKDREQGYSQQITVPFSWVSPLSMIGEDAPGVGWYRREASFSSRERVWLCFGAIDYLAALFINGTPVAQHEGGYTPFETDVTEYWRQDAPNIIELRAEDMRHPWQMRGKQGYGDSAGIWQTVWLESRPAAYIEHVRITTLISGDVTFEASLAGCPPQPMTLKASFEGHEAQVSVLPAAAGNTHTERFTLRISEPKLWSPESPALYFGTLSLHTADTADTLHTYFGIREICAAPVKDAAYTWLQLNRTPVYINGALDQSFYGQGHFTAPSDDELRADVWRLKRLGINLARIHIKAEDPRKLYWMDKLGMLVMEDIPCFYKQPTQQAMDAYERQWHQIIRRDINHPGIISFVLFNETWGLMHTLENNEHVYLPETRRWVETVYNRAKQLDPSRLIEDNSPCNYDHTVTDLNTWHFYHYGYEKVREHIRNVVSQTYPGSAFNCAQGYTQSAAPLLNSECGMVWGVDNTAGDSDLAWQYHYMLNEFRLHEKICGFVFTEFHDVVNEFNGYYRLDRSDKRWGYENFCRGMSLRDLHGKTFAAIDAPPCQTVAFGETVSVPVVLSCFDGEHIGRRVTVECELWHEGLLGAAEDRRVTLNAAIDKFGTQAPMRLEVTMPAENALAVLSLYVKLEDGSVVSRNFTTFDVRGDFDQSCLCLPVAGGRREGFSPAWTAMDGQKSNFGGQGTVHFSADVSRFAFPGLNGLQLIFEAGAKRVLARDLRADGEKEKPLNFLNGRHADRGDFENSYFMTDESRFPSTVEVLIDGEPIHTLYLQNDYADARGVLSWHAQKHPRHIDEAGSYGQAFRIEIPSRLIPAILKRGLCTISFRVLGNGGLALYDRGSGRYPFGIVLRAW